MDHKIHIINALQAPCVDYEPMTQQTTAIQHFPNINNSQQPTRPILPQLMCFLCMSLGATYLRGFHIYLPTM